MSAVVECYSCMGPEEPGHSVRIVTCADDDDGGDDQHLNGIVRLAKHFYRYHFITTTQ